MDTQLTVTQLTDRVDEIDGLIHDEILMMCQDQQVLSLIDYYCKENFGTEKAGENFLDKVFGSSTSLLKANAHLRNYRKLLPILTKSLEESNDFSKTNVDMLFNLVDIFIEFEGFLTKLKTSLDQLAQAISPTLGKYFETYGKAVVGAEEVSGGKIINFINHSSNQRVKTNMVALVKLMTQKSAEITAMVRVRDDFLHRAKSKNVQGFRYSNEHGRIFSPTILVAPEEVLYVHDYMEEKLNFILKFNQEFLQILLSNLLPDMVRRKGSKGQWGWYTNPKKPEQT